MSTLSPLGALPHYASRLVGRDAEIALIRQLIADDDIPIITITGTAGVGKSRLAATIARNVADDYEHGVVFVPLATITDPDLVPAEIAKSLGLMNDHSPEAIKDRLATWNGILLLDNLEQVIRSAADIAAIMPFNPDLTVLTTSQRPLQIAGERVVRLHPLPIPENDAGESEIRENLGVQLLIDRAANLDSSLMDDLEDPETINCVGQICRRLDGIPLALELAAPRLVQFSPEVVLAQLDQGHDILSGASADAPERHRTMHSAIAWSFELIPHNTRRIFTRLSVFPSGFDLDLVERVTASVGGSTSAIDTIGELISLSMITRVSGGSNPWYTMLVSIREHCIAELDETGDRDAAEDLRAEYVQDLLQQTEAKLKSERSGEWSTFLERSFPTIRAAVLRSSPTHHPALPMQAAYRLERFLNQSDKWREGIRWVEVAQDWQTHLTSRELGEGLLGKFSLFLTGRDFANINETESMLTALFQEHDLPDLEKEFLLNTAHLALVQHRLDEAELNYHRVLDLTNETEDPVQFAKVNLNLAEIARLRRQFDKAKELLMGSLPALRALREPLPLAVLLGKLADIAIAQKDTDAAVGYIDEASFICREHQFFNDLLYVLTSKAVALIDLGEYDLAMETAEEVLELSIATMQSGLEAQTHYMMGGISYLKGDYAATGHHLQAVLALTTISDIPQMFVSVANLMAATLAKTGYYTDASVIAAGNDIFAERIGFCMTEEQAELRSETLDIINESLGSSARGRTFDQSMSNDDWSRQMKASASKLVAKPPYLLVNIPENTAATPPYQDLTPREAEILQLLIDGKSTRQMADVLSISPRTVTTHLANIMAKMEVSSRSELVARALRNT